MVCVVRRHQGGDIVKLIIVTPENYDTKSSLLMISCYSAPVSLVSPSNSISFLDFKLPRSKRGLSRGPLLTALIRRGPSACWKVYGADNELSNDNF